MENTLQELNQLLLTSESASSNGVFYHINHLMNTYKLKLILIDFKKYNQEKLNEIKKVKQEAASKNDFELAAKYRVQEDKYQEYVDLKACLQIENPCFSIDRGHLFFFYFGKSKIEEDVKDFFHDPNNAINK